MKAILVGAGGVARELLRRLGESWEVTVVDTSPERLAEAEGLRSFRAVRGDGSSRVVLERAGLGLADALVAATPDDDVNLEACLLAREADVFRLVAVANDPGRLDDYRAIGVTAISPDSLAARRLEVNLETRRVASMAFADGRAEAIEFRIEKSSPVCGKVLRDLHAHSWIVGAVLRGNHLIIPHGDTVLREGDLVTVVGAGADFAEMVRTFTSGESRFPLGYGKRVAVALETEADLDGSVQEAIYLVRNSRASSVLLVHRDPDSLRDEAWARRQRDLLETALGLAEGVAVRPRPVRGRPSRVLGHLPAGESVGVVVVPAPGRAPGARSTGGPVGLVRRTVRPVLLSRGHGYERILVPARRTPAGRAAERAAIDLARFTRARLQALAVEDPYFISGPGAPVEAHEAIAWIEEEAAAHGVPVAGLVRRGNPVKILVDTVQDSDLLVLGATASRRKSLRVGRGIAALVARRANRSVLLVPSGEPA